MSLTSQVNKLTVFKPTDIQGCTVWFDAYDPTTLILSGNSVTLWRSKGSSTIEATASGSLSPTYSNYTSGNPGLYFNGANKMTSGGATYGTSGMTWITASLETVRVTADAAAIIATNGAGAERSIRYNVNVIDANIYTINTSVIRQITGENTPGVRGFVDTAATLKTYVNGTATTINTAVTYQPAVNQGFVLGQWNIGYLTGYIFECIVYDSALSLTDYQKVEGYLAWKWGFQGRLAAGHPYLTNAFAPLFPHLPYTIPMSIKQTKDSVPPYFARSSGQFKPISVTATGGTITFANVSGIDYRIHTFTSVGTANFTLTFPASVITTVLVVAGGGAGGYDDGGGGGAGGVIYNAAFTITSGSYTVTVGNGGASNGASGANSVLSSLTAIGGGGGANGNASGSNGGSGGGIGWGVGNGAIPGSGTAGQGFAGGGGTTAPNYAVGGGGGAGGVGGTGSGTTPGNGGIGVSRTIAGTTYNVGGGGGGGLANQNSSGTNSTASFGGGNGAGHGANAAVAGTPNTGGGGGGSNNEQATNGAFGGSGIVIIAYQYQ